MSPRLGLIVLVAALLGLAAARAEAEWTACEYLSAIGYGVAALVLLIGGVFLVATSSRRRRP